MPDVTPGEATTGIVAADALAKGSLPFQVIDDLIAGRIQTHIDLPTRNPFAYAMRHEFLDALTAECRHPDRFKNLVLTRELMDNVMFAYATYGDPDLGDLSGTSFAEAYLAIIANPLSKLYPAHAIRLDLAKNPQGYVREVVSGLGGCDSPQVLRLRENLDAIAVMGPLLAPDATLLREEISTEAGQLNCFYANPGRPDYDLFQPYQFATPANVALFVVPWQAHLAPFEFFPHAACPATPDPAFGLMEAFIPPEPDTAALPQGDRAERLAAAFLDQYIPAYVDGPDGTALILDPDLRARYFEEIVRFERIDVPPEEVERVRAEREAAAAAGNAPSQRLDTISIEVDLRLKIYRERYGRGLWAVIDEVAAVSGSRGASYITARADSGFLDDAR